MKLIAWGGKGIGVFAERFDFPLDELGNARVIAVTGDNGAGKSTALGCVPGAIYGHVPGYGRLATLAVGHDTVLDARVEVGGKEVAIRHLVDATKSPPKIESYLKDGDGISNGKQGAFKTEVAKRFPSLEVYLASAFASQRREGGFLRLAPADRKALFSEMLSLHRYGEICQWAKGKAVLCSGEMHDLQIQIGMLDTGWRTADELEHLIANVRRSIDEWRDEIKKIGIEKLVASKRIKAWRTASVAAKEKVIKQDCVHGELRRELDAAISRRDWLSADLRRKREELCSMQQSLTDLETSSAESLKLIYDGHVAETEIHRLIEEVSNAQTARHALQMNLQAAEREQLDAKNRADRNIHDLRGQLVAAKDRLAESLKTSSVIRKVSCSAIDRDRCPLLREVNKTIPLIPDNRRVVTHLENTLEAALSAAASDAARMRKAAEKARIDLEESVKRVDDLSQRKADMLDAVTKGQIASSGMERFYKLRDRVIPELEQSVSDIDGELAATHNKIPELSLRVNSHLADLNAAKNEVFKLEQSPPVDPSCLTNRETELHRKLGAGEAELESLCIEQQRAAEARQKIAEMRSKINKETQELADWNEIARVFGPNGLPALEIDEAGPVVSSVANDLLHACYGPRFSLSLVTTQLRADGKGSKDVFDLRVIDSERGGDRMASKFSGGEEVLIDEALSLAIAIFHSQRSGIVIGDLFRDECSGALSDENAQRYVQMLRRALDVGGFSRVFFVTHQMALISLADSQVDFSCAQCRVV